MTFDRLSVDWEAGLLPPLSLSPLISDSGVPGPVLDTLETYVHLIFMHPLRWALLALCRREH